jgi:hypothetical protein
MSKKDYILIGNALRKAKSRQLTIGGIWNQSSLIAWELAVDEITDALQTDNPLFNSSKFLKYVKEG